MIKAIDVKENETAKKVVDLQKSSYAIEANIIGYYEIPPLKDTIASIRQCNEQFFGYSISLDTRYGFKQIELIESPEGIDLAVFEKFL